MKETLLKLLENIKQDFGLTQGEISELAGYASNYLAVIISKNQISQKVLRNVQRVYDEAKNKKSIPVSDAGGMILENQIELLASNRVILSVLAELQAPQVNRLPTELASIYRRMVKDEALQVRGELKQR